VLVNEWVEESAGRPIFAGMGVYKASEGKFPASDLLTQIDVARAAGAGGQSAFRFDHLLQHADLLAAKYPYPALPEAMAHRFEAAAPSEPTNLTLRDAPGGGIELSWLASAGSSLDPLRSYVILRRQDAPPDAERAADLLAVVDATQTGFTDSTTSAGAVYFYRVAARSALGMISPPSEPASSGMPTAIAEADRKSRATTIVSVFPNPSSQNARIVYFLETSSNIELILYDTIGRRASRILSGPAQAGTHNTEIATDRLANGVYQVVLRAADAVSTWPMMINR
jgi:hypothetical protein